MSTKRKSCEIENTVWIQQDQQQNSVPDSCQFVSFDVGTSNMGFCRLGFDRDRKMIVREWKVISLSCGGQETIQLSAVCLIETFKTLFPLGSFVDQTTTTILIEDQPPKNDKTFALSFCISTFFTMRFPTLAVYFVNSKSKLKLCDDLMVFPTRSYAANHSANKSISKQATQVVLNTCNLSHTLTWFNKQRKRDDLADSFLQILAWGILHQEPNCMSIVNTVNQRLNLQNTSVPLIKIPKRKPKKPRISHGQLLPGT